jgi:tRNA G18 (ribose-2'-O)-methylase SpoU
MRGYFAVGVDGVSKPMNLGNLMRIAHAFGASFFFTVDARVKLADAQSDTSRAHGQLPFFAFAQAADFRLPKGCELVGVEIADDATELPRFRHPSRAAYAFGGERTSLSREMLSRCAHVVRIPTRFSINVGMAGAIVLYDRLISTGGYGARPIAPGLAAEVPPRHVWGAPLARTRKLQPLS